MEEIKLMIQDYDTLSITKIAQKNNVSKDVIKRIFKENKIKIKNFTEVRAFVKVNPFLNLLDPEVQYWLGWLATDGNISRYSIKLNLTDKSIIENFAKFCGLTHINEYRPKKLTESIMYRVQFSNKNIAEYLINLGITRNKSETLKLNIPITWPLLLGIIEGDGWIHKHKNKDRITIGICSISEIFILQIKEFLEQQNIFYCLSKRLNNGGRENSKLFILTINRKVDLKIMKDKLYNVSFNILERKKEVLDNFDFGRK